MQLSRDQMDAVNIGIGSKNFTFEVVDLGPPITYAGPEIKDFDIDWMQGYANSPKLVVTFAEALPRSFWDAFLFEHRNGVYYAEHAGFVELHYHNGKPEKQDGYGGRVFTLPMKDGTEKKLHGPWHVGEDAANRAGFGPIAEVTHRAPTAGGHMMSYFGLYITHPLLSYLRLRFMPERQFARVSKYGSWRLEPLTLNGLPKELDLENLA